ncbi:MAG: ATP-grasp domain-containing protein [Lachnospiraceae bacterium]|nr:ATP-grasp domain-containing protein [Lachnospiraceae bacterium]
MALSFTEKEFIPVMLGGDINTYSVSRAFYEKYNVKCYVFGKYPTGPSFDSRIIEYEADPRIETDEYFVERINKFAADHKDKTIILVGCGDSYVALCSKHKAELAENIITPYIDYELMHSLQMKETFYGLCDKWGIDYPGTVIYDRSMGKEFEMNFEYPVIMKPSNGIQYWEHPFDTQKKVYTIHDRDELISVLDDIYGAGYTDKMIIQDRIPGNDEYMRVLTSYSDHNGKVKMMCLGHVLLEEHTPHGLGNHALIITEPNDELMERVKNLLESMHYVGYSNFDIKYDTRDGKFKFFEINTRQGRSNFYVTGSGFNVAEYITEDYFYGKDLPLKYAREERLWTVVPKGVALKYVKDEDLKSRMKKLWKDGKVVNPVFLKGDSNPGRMYRMIRTYFSHYVKFKKYYKI